MLKPVPKRKEEITFTLSLLLLKQLVEVYQEGCALYLYYLALVGKSEKAEVPEAYTIGIAKTAPRKSEPFKMESALEADFSFASDSCTDGLNWYVYCNNNPLSMVDPTGLESAYLVDKEAVAGSGHAGMWVENYDDEGNTTGYTAYESINFIVEGLSNELYGRKGRETEGYISVGADGTGIYMATFKDREKLQAYLDSRSFDREIVFKTGQKADEAMHRAAQLLAPDFKFDIFNNNCADLANSIFKAGGITGMSGWYPNTNFDQIYKLSNLSNIVKEINDSGREGLWTQNLDKLTLDLGLFGKIARNKADKEDFAQTMQGR